MAMSDSDFEVWGRVRRMGRVRFVLGIGVLGFGVPFALLFSLLFCLVVRAMGDPRPPLWWFVFTAALSLLGGLAFGLYQWYTSERAYGQWVSSRSDAGAVGPYPEAGPEGRIRREACGDSDC
jgi:hypothetical protein